MTFWFDERPPTYPLLIWMFGPGARAVIVVQTLLAVLAWCWLFSTVWRGISRRPIAVATIVVLFLVAIQTRWLFWHTAHLTESLSGTLAIAGIAAWWRWFDTPERWRLVVATLITAAWMLLRDSNAVTLFVVALPAVVLVLVLERRSTSTWRRGMAAALAAIIVIGAYSMSAQMVTDRGETSLHNNVGLRWLADDGMTDFMVARGMPLTDALSERAGQDAWADGEAFLTSPFLSDYRVWADGRGRLASAESFVVRADWYLDRLWNEVDSYTTTDPLAYDTFVVAQNFPERTLGPVDPVGSRTALVVSGALTLAAAALAWRFRRRRAWLLLFLTVPVIADLYLSFAADAVEVGRHMVGPMMRFAVTTVIAVAIGADTVFDARSQRRDEPWITVEHPDRPEHPERVVVDRAADA